MSWLEVIAVVLNVAYVLLAAYGNPLCWPAGIVASACYVFFNIELKYYQDALLQSFYVLAGFYGWYFWLMKKNNKESAVQSYRISQQWQRGVLGLALSLVMGYLFSHTDARKPYLDALTTAFSFVATWMTARKILQSWLWWIAIDLLLSYQYAVAGAWLSSGLYLFFTATAIFGFVKWQQLFKLQPQQDAA